MCTVMLHARLPHRYPITVYSDARYTQGPYITYVDRIYDCTPPNGTVLAWRTAIRVSPFIYSRPFDKQRMRGTVNGTIPFSDNMWVSVPTELRGSSRNPSGAFTRVC